MIEMELTMFSVNIYMLKSMDHDPKRVTIFMVKDNDPKTGTDPEGSIPNTSD